MTTKKLLENDATNTVLLVLTLSMGMIIGIIIMFFIFTFNVGNVIDNNGLMYKDDCLLLDLPMNSSYLSTSLNTTIKFMDKPCSNIYCSSGCWFRIRNCNYDIDNFLNDSYLKDLINRKVITKEYCKGCEE